MAEEGKGKKRGTKKRAFPASCVKVEGKKQLSILGRKKRKRDERTLKGKKKGRRASASSP